MDDGSDWSSLHELALIYLALTHSSEAEVRPPDMDTVQTMLKTWYPGASPARIEAALQEALLAYVSDTGELMLSVAVASLRQTMPRDQRIAVLSDLTDIALADGFIVPDEASFIEKLAQEWGIEQDVQ